MTLNNLGRTKSTPPPPPYILNQFSPSYEILHGTTQDLLKNTKIVINVMWLFWWRYHFSRRSLKLNIFMNKLNSPYITKQVYNTQVYWKCIFRKVIVSFFYTFWTQIRLILSRIYSLFQQKIYTKNNSCSWKSADIAKSS